MVHNIDITHHQHDTFHQNSEQPRKQKQERHRRSQRADDAEITAGRFFPCKTAGNHQNVEVRASRRQQDEADRTGSASILGKYKR